MNTWRILVFSRLMLRRGNGKLIFFKPCLLFNNHNMIITTSKLYFRINPNPREILNYVVGLLDN